MRFLVINTDYPDFIRWLYLQHPGLEKLPYAEQHRARMDTSFGMADFYSSNLRKLGHEACDVIANIEPMQRQWAQEHDVELPLSWEVRLRRGIVPWLHKKDEWMHLVLAAQVKAYHPDVLISMAMHTISDAFLRRVEGHYRLAIGQHAATPLKVDIRRYDLVVSSLPNQVSFFRQLGMKAELLRLGFEPRILKGTRLGSKRFDIAFVGGLGGIHRGGAAILEVLANRHRVSVWGYGVKEQAADSKLRQCYRGQLWGMDMFQALRDSKIVFNRHSNLADRYFANNMRLFETTGVGSLLLTDWKQNLNDMFQPGREVIAYRNAGECVELADHYVTHDEEREAVASAGQRRTLREHTYLQRMQELVSIVQQYV